MEREETLQGDVTGWMERKETLQGDVIGRRERKAAPKGVFPGAVSVADRYMSVMPAVGSAARPWRERFLAVEFVTGARPWSSSTGRTTATTVGEAANDEPLEAEGWEERMLRLTGVDPALCPA